MHWAGVLALVGSLLLGAPSPLSAQTAPEAPGQRPSLDLQFSNSYVEQARRAAQRQLWPEAIALLDEALRFLPDHADAAYLRALCGWQSGQSLASLIPYLETALLNNHFFYYRRAEAAWLYALVMLQTKHYEAALHFLADQVPEERVLRLRIEALRLAGQQDELFVQLHQFLDLYPEQSAALVPWLHQLDEDFRTAAEAAVVERLLRLLPALATSQPALALALVPFVPELSERRYLLREYRAMQEPNARATRLALTLGLIDDQRAVEELFSGRYIPEDGDLPVIYHLLKDDAARAAFARAFQDYTGQLASDWNHDGIVEQIVQYQSGLITSLTLDSDQDGRVDGEAYFLEGRVERIALYPGSVSLSLEYQTWPWLATVYIRQDGVTRRYQLPLRALAWPMLQYQLVADSAAAGLYTMQLRAIDPPSERALARLAGRVDEVADSHTRSASLYNGLPLQSWYSDRYGLVSRALHDQNGLVRSEELDLNGDGWYEARRAWSLDSTLQPLAVYIDIDSLGDGFFDYRELLVSPFTRNWDLDRDGHYDLSLTPGAGGVQTWRFASRPDRDFDLTIEYAGGRLASVSRAGQVLAVVADSNRQVFWLGRKAFDFGGTTPAPGWGARGMVRYYVLAIQDSLFVEILD
ncbi:MAG: hypothetical protein A2087_14305 [Spirochaetes bacterium GWD1_61_31]|nr:MAG: hypothetical protein A2Y37_04195 [Spirochaetes bacterium GWB1_60_80]OHD34848.1 MAG: hypothetical protein A2087_14305 [Spirochaetes bacterium GWD1_61_31]OHD46694.1 MAG: hypothetical protein A2Y35_11130 [Spirochaetes bacterium GWE1_60_18]OHD60323.1 MAG: hypothetical protein A2Y32_14695 [Spirochaetes bacterium GWF1_60_12]HAP44221.1 hypothetical protein [Spirochaetaceae bacterium]